MEKKIADMKSAGYPERFEISLTRKKKVSVRGEAIWMIYVAIRKVICSLDLAASSLQGWRQSKIISKHDVGTT